MLYNLTKKCYNMRRQEGKRSSEPNPDLGKGQKTEVDKMEISFSVSAKLLAHRAKVRAAAEARLADRDA